MVTRFLKISIFFFLTSPLTGKSFKGYKGGQETYMFGKSITFTGTLIESLNRTQRT